MLADSDFHTRREERYHAKAPEPAYIPRVADAGNIKSVEPHYEYETKQGIVKRRKAKRRGAATSPTRI